MSQTRLIRANARIYLPWLPSRELGQGVDNVRGQRVQKETQNEVFVPVTGKPQHNRPDLKHCSTDAVLDWISSNSRRGHNAFNRLDSSDAYQRHPVVFRSR